MKRNRPPTADRRRPRIAIVGPVLPYRTLIALLPRRTRVILQCHNIGEKEPAWWKRALANLVLRRGDVLVVHAKSEAEEAKRRFGERVVQTFLPVHEMGGIAPARE